MAPMQVLGASESARGKTMQHKLEMKGSIPPWVLDRLTGVFKDAHPVKFQVCFALHLCRATAVMHSRCN